jgi:Kdo2-lipid IVA lauroyltransferase/acyltransferase
VSTWMLRAIAAAAALLSWKGVRRLGAFLGTVWYRLVRIRRGVVRENLGLGLPERAAEHDRIALGCYRHLCISTLELLKTRHMSSGRVLSLVRHRGLENYERAAERGRGVIAVTAHVGNFDLLACSQALRGVELGIVSRELRESGSNRFWMETRAATGLRIFSDRSSLRELLRWLREGRALGLVVDQRTPAERGGLLVPFLGEPAWTTSTPAALALRTGAALVPVRARRLEDGSHEVGVEPEIPLPERRGAEEVALLTERINEIVSRWIRDTPEQWMWLHRRFAGVPRGEPEGETRS